MPVKVGEPRFSAALLDWPLRTEHGVALGHRKLAALDSDLPIDREERDHVAQRSSAGLYFGSELPEKATPALQADIYANLLDALEVERSIVMGFSAGGPSTIEFALRHPERVELLVLASSALPREPIPRLGRESQVREPAATYLR